jgi:hypothetical protein
MFAVTVNGINFWEESEKSGFQVTDTIKELEDSDGVGFESTLRWVTSAKDISLLSERRNITARVVPGTNATMVTWRSIVKVAEYYSEVTLSGAHYHGLGMRFLNSMNKIGKFVTANNRSGEIFRGQERLISDSWCAYTMELGDFQVTAAMFSSPDNPGGSAVWFTMKEPFAYLSATLKLHENPVILSTDNQLKLTYGVVLWDKVVGSSQIEEAFQLWKGLIDK